MDGAVRVHVRMRLEVETAQRRLECARGGGVIKPCCIVFRPVGQRSFGCVPPPLSSAGPHLLEGNADQQARGGGKKARTKSPCLAGVGGYI